MTEQPDPVRITLEHVVAGDVSDLFFAVYSAAFDIFRTKAAARYLMSREEFDEQMTDRRVVKIVAWSRAAEPVGLTTLTNDLTTVPWISPHFYARRFPEQAARKAIYYTAFALVDPTARLEGTYRRMIETAARLVAEDRGVVGYDMAGYNLGFGLPSITESIISAQSPATIDAVDTQTYFAAEFHGNAQPDTVRGD